MSMIAVDTKQPSNIGVNDMAQTMRMKQLRWENKRCTVRTKPKRNLHKKRDFIHGIFGGYNGTRTQ
jgi:hypothetical protein